MEFSGGNRCRPVAECGGEDVAVGVGNEKTAEAGVDAAGSFETAGKVGNGKRPAGRRLQVERSRFKGMAVEVEVALDSFADTKRGFAEMFGGVLPDKRAERSSAEKEYSQY